MVLSTKLRSNFIPNMSVVSEAMQQQNAGVTQLVFATPIKRMKIDAIGTFIEATLHEPILVLSFN